MNSSTSTTAPVAIVALHVSQFSLQSVLRHDPGAWHWPVILLDPGARIPCVLDATDAARRSGIADGVTAPQAMARCREVRIWHRSLHQEALTTEAMLQCAYGFSPHLESTEPGLVTLDLRGLPGLTGGPLEPLQAWCARLLEAMGRLNLRSRLGVGGTPNVARLAARWGGIAVEGRPGALVIGSGAITVVTDPETFVRSLPLEALGPSSDGADRLRRWGIRDVGGLLSLGRTEVTDRLGLEALALFAAASVTTARPLNFVQPRQCFEEEHHFETPVETLEPLLFLMRRFADALGQRLESCGMAAGELRLALELDNGETLETRLRLPQASRRSDVLFRALHTHLETLRTTAPVRRVGLHVEPARPEQRQFDLFETPLRDPHLFQETLARLAALVGSERVGSPRRENSHRPDAFSLVPPDFDSTPGSEGLDCPETVRPVPIRRIRPGVPAALDVDPTFRPRRLHSPIASGRLVEVDGPWESSGQWWDRHAWARSEWDVRTRDGLVLRISRQADRWQVEGLLD